MLKQIDGFTSRPVHRRASKQDEKSKHFNTEQIEHLQATRSAADERIGMPIAGILRLAKRSRPPLTPRPAKMYGPFFLSSNSMVRAVSPGRAVVLAFEKKNGRFQWT